jgi:hypothetical protein
MLLFGLARVACSFSTVTPVKNEKPGFHGMINVYTVSRKQFDILRTNHFDPNRQRLNCLQKNKSCSPVALV